MSHITLGIDINHTSLRYAKCEYSGINQPMNVLEMDTIPVMATEGSDGLDDAFKMLSERLSSSKSTPVDAIGLSLDPTCALSAHRILPFKDPKLVEQVLRQSMMESWKMDEEAHLAFEIGSFVEGNPQNEGEEAQPGTPSGGYDVHVINYPFSTLKEILERLKRVRIEPNVALPSTDAIGYALNSIIHSPEGVWAIIDIGEKDSVFTVCEGNEVKLTRAMKLGGELFDKALSEALAVELVQAKELKEKCGFICDPGNEEAVYRQLVSRGYLEPSDVNPVQIAEVCRNTMAHFLTAIQQTIGNFALQNHCEPTCIYLIGGGAKLCGLAKWLTTVLEVKCEIGLPLQNSIASEYASVLSMDIDAVSVAIASSAALDNHCPLNLRCGLLSHKGSLSYLLDNKWLIASCVLCVIIALIFMTNTKANSIHQEHEKLKAALEETSTRVFGKKLMTYNQIEQEIAESEGYRFIPVRTAFSHFSWISSNVNDNLADVEMDLNSMDIDNQRKIVTLRGEITGDEGLPKFMQLLEQYECFPNEIPEPKTTKVKERTSFTLRIESNHCTTGGDSE